MDSPLPETADVVREGVAQAMSGFDHAYWSRCEDEHRFPTEAWKALADGGWIGLAVPEEYGGAFQVFGGMAYSKEFPVERLFRDARIAKNIPVAEELILANLGTQALGLPRSC